MLFEQKADVQKQVIQIIVKQLDLKPYKVRMSSTFVEDLGTDSLDIVELIMTFEYEFSIEIPDEDAKKIRTVGDVINYICGFEGDKRKVSWNMPTNVLAENLEG